MKFIKGTYLRETIGLFPLGPNRKFVGELSYSFES
jgi:hypothetical protein